MKLWPTMRTVKRVMIGVMLLVAALLLANATAAWQAERRLENKRAELRAAGQPASIADLAPQPVPDEANAAVHLKRIEPQLDAFNKPYIAFYQSEPGNTWSQRQDAGLLPTPEQAASMRAILDAYPEILPAFERAAAREDYASLLDFKLVHSPFIQAIIDRQTYIRTLARLVDWKVALLIAEGKADDATRLGTQLLKLGRLYENEPTLVNFLVSIAVRGVAIDMLNRSIRSGPIASETRSRLIAELDRQDRPALPKALQTEWAMVLDYTPGPIVPATAGWSITNWQLNEAASLDETIALAARPYYEIRDQLNATTDAKVKGMQSGMLLMPAIRAAIQAEARRLALVRCLRILIALDEHRQRTGQEAAGLADLALPASAVIDPHSGDALKLKRTDAGWIVYSVMENAVDDDGDFAGQKDWGLVPPGYGGRR